jgi:hypothetical protein
MVHQVKIDAKGDRGRKAMSMGSGLELPVFPFMDF